MNKSLLNFYDIFLKFFIWKISGRVCFNFGNETIVLCASTVTFYRKYQNEECNRDGVMLRL